MAYQFTDISVDISTLFELSGISIAESQDL